MPQWCVLAGLGMMHFLQTDTNGISFFSCEKKTRNVLKLAWHWNCPDNQVHGMFFKNRVETSYYRRISRWCLGGFVVVEDDHDQVPVPVTEVPRDPGWVVGGNDHGQQDHVADQQDGAGQDHHQTHKHLTCKNTQNTQHTHTNYN